VQVRLVKDSAAAPYGKKNRSRVLRTG